MKQKQTTWNSKEVLLVEVPEDGYDFRIINPTSKNKPSLDYNKKGSTANYQTLPPGSYRFAFASPLSPTEAEAGELVEKVKDWPKALYYDYIASGRDFRDIVEAAFDRALPSLRSRIKAEGFDNPERVIVLIKN